MSYAKLRGKIREVYGTQEAFARAIGLSKPSLSQRLMGKVPWKTPEVAEACRVLGIPIEENVAYFFDY